jgi:hypothetical protein
MYLKKKIKKVLFDYKESNLKSSAVRDKIANDIRNEIQNEVQTHFMYQNSELTKDLLTKTNRINTLERIIRRYRKN